MSSTRPPLMAVCLAVLLVLPAAATGQDHGSVDVAPPRPAIVVLDAGAEPRVELRYQLTEGQREGLVLTSGGAGRYSEQGTTSPWLETASFAVTGTSTVTAANEDGSFDIATEVTGVEMVEEGADPAMLAQLQAQFDGLSMRYRIDAHGRLLESDTTASPGAVAAGIQPGMIDSMSLQMTHPLPSEPVGVGAVWETRSEATDPNLGFTMVTTTTTTLDAIRPDGTFEISGRSQMDSPDRELDIPGMPEGFSVMLDGLSGDLFFRRIIDPTKAVAEGEGGGTVAMAMSVDTGEEVMSSTTEMRMGMRQVATEPMDE